MIAQLINASIGLWLMIAPAALGYGGAWAVSDRIVGPCVLSLAWVAAGQCTRSVRLWLRPLALWLVAAPLALSWDAVPAINSAACGMAIVGLSFVRGRIDHHFGGGWVALFRAERLSPAGAGGSDQPSGLRQS